MRRFGLSLLLLLTFTVFGSSAQIPKPKKNTYVNDLAGVLNLAEETKLNKAIFQVEQKRGVQVAIVLVKKIPAAYDIEDFAVLIGKKWGVGKGQKGIVYVAAIRQRKQRIEVARKLDEYFPNDVSLGLLDRVKPGFKAKDYAAGLHELVAGIDEILPMTEAEQKREQVRADSVQAVVKQAAIAKEKADALAEAESSRSFWKGAAIFLSVILGLYLIRKIFKKDSTLDGPAGGPGYYVGDDDHASSGYSSSRRYNSYGSYGGSYRSSGSRLGSFATGAATGYSAHSLQDQADDERRERERREEEERREDEERREREEREREEEERRREEEERDRAENAPRNWGNWGGGSSSGGSSENSGFTTGSSSGATSDW